MSKIQSFCKKMLMRVDLPFLLFLLTISSNKVYLKVVALILIFALRPKFDFLFSKKIPLFYPLLVILTTFQFLFLGHDFSANHLMAFMIGIFYWIMCYAYMYQTYMFININSIARINNTIATLLCLNFVLCVFNYFQVCVNADSLFPFLQYGGDYGASTGDYITGLFGQPSYINSMVCAFFAIYYLHTKNTGLFFLSTLCLILPFANIITLIFLALIILYGVFSRDSVQRILVLTNVILCLIIYACVSPDNYNYLKKTIGLSVLDEREIMPSVLVGETKNAAARTASRQSKYVNDSSAADQKIFMTDRLFLFNRNYDEYTTYYPIDFTKSPGKKIAVLQTISFLKHNPIEAVFGAGVGNFSSRLAFQLSGRDSSRLFSKLPKYCSGYYFKNSLLIYDIMISLPMEYRSIKHFPNNFLSQLLGEYGLLGLILFIGFYVVFFYKKTGNRLFFLTLLACTTSFLLLDNLYEYFNVMVVFELLLFLNIKEQKSSER
jgi:hypothetical protein